MQLTIEVPDQLRQAVEDTFPDESATTWLCGTFAAELARRVQEKAARDVMAAMGLSLESTRPSADRDAVMESRRAEILAARAARRGGPPPPPEH